MNEDLGCIGPIVVVAIIATFAFSVGMKVGVSIGQPRGEVAIWKQAVEAGVAEPVANMDTGRVEYKFKTKVDR